VFTRGNIFGQSNLDISGSGHIYGFLQVDTGRIVYQGENIYGTANLFSNATVASTMTTSTLSVLTGKVFLNSRIAGQATLGVGGTVGVSTAACTANSIIFLQHNSISGPLGILSVANIAAGSFTINSSQSGDRGAVMWMIVN
jgi:hypothetical protein